MSGGGGGGGGSGTFLYSSSANGDYFLLAGGGSGASGGSYLSPGGAGGAGGTIGPGGGGGGSGWFALTSGIGTGDFNAPGGAGGKGGGKGGGSAGTVAGPGGNAASVVLTSNASVIGGSGAASYSDFSISSHFPFLYVSSGSVAISGSTFPPLPSAITDNRILALRTTVAMSVGSGQGGSSAAIDTFNWLFTTVAAAAGARSRALRAFSVSDVAISGDYASTPGSYLSSWNSPNPSFAPLELTIGAAYPGRPGVDGGNNRNGSIGSGAAHGSPGSVTIRKVYTEPLKP